jgi:hypothetical protein
LCRSGSAGLVHYRGAHAPAPLSFLPALTPPNPSQKHPPPPIKTKNKTARRLKQANDADTVTGTNILRTNRYARLSNSAAQALQANDVQAAVQQGDTTLLGNSQASYTAGRTSRDVRADLTQNEVQGAIGTGPAQRSVEKATGATALWSTQGSLSSGNGVRESVGAQESSSAIQNALDNPNGAFRATSVGAESTTIATYRPNYANWT